MYAVDFARNRALNVEVQDTFLWSPQCTSARLSTKTGREIRSLLDYFGISNSGAWQTILIWLLRACSQLYWSRFLKGNTPKCTSERSWRDVQDLHSIAPLRPNKTAENVLGCIEANFCKKICVWKLSPRSTQCTPLHSSAISFFCQNLPIFLQKFAKINFEKF